MIKAAVAETKHILKLKSNFFKQSIKFKSILFVLGEKS